MEMSTFAIDDGFVEAMVRGFRSGFLSDESYASIKTCNNLQELKIVLEETDYGPYLQTEGSNLPVTQLRARLKKKLADEFAYMQAQAVYPLSEFLRLMLCRFMIDNVVNIIEGLKNGVNPEDLIANADPLGYFPEIKNMKIVDADDFTGLYSTVLIDTPVGPYFSKFLEDNIGEDTKTLQEVHNIFKELKPEQIRTSLKKMWLENFYSFIQKECGSMTKEVMGDLLNFEADFKTIQVIYNSIGNKDLTSIASRTTTRKRLCPSLGYLYPDCEKALVEVTTLDSLKAAVVGISTYGELLKEAPDPTKKEEYNPNAKSLDDLMYEEEVRKYSLAFEGQCHYAVFYTYLKLKEQEIRNITWYAELVARKLPKNHPGWKKIIVPFRWEIQK